MKPRFFPTPTSFRSWLRKNHASAEELWVGFYKVDSGKKSITWPEAVDEALCVGWIDAVRKSIDETSYMIRFVPRRPTSNWSAVNIKRVAELQSAGRMQSAGLRAFEARTERKSAIYSYENEARELDEAATAQFRANAKAWEFFQQQPPWYRRQMTYWVMTAKKEETRARRLARLIEDSAKGKRVER